MTILNKEAIAKIEDFVREDMHLLYTYRDLRAVNG